MSKAIEVPNQSTNQLKRLARQSTIYRRHEARLARSIVRRDDPRPAPVRVLSGLPFFRNFVASYKPPSASVAVQKEPMTSPPSVSFSQDTIFTNKFGSADSSFQRADNVNHSVSLNTLVPGATAGVVAATLLAPTQAIQSHMVARRIAFTVPQLSFQLAAMSLLQKNGLSGLYRGSKIVYGREIMAFTIYFSSYDAIKCHFSNGDDHKTTTPKASMTTVASSGAAAGMLYRSVVCAFNSVYSGCCIGLGLSRAFFPSVLRAAPSSALFFVGYETALELKSASKQQ